MKRPFLAFALAIHAAAPAATADDLLGLQIVGNIPFDSQLKAITAVGMRRARLGVRWGETEVARGRYDWTLADRKVGDLQRAGITPIITLFGGNKAYRTNAADGAGPPADGEALAGFARFAAAVAARYRSTRPDMPILFEIWNEPNTKTFWGRPPEPEAYARMAGAACAAIKAAAPDARVLALAMEGTPVKARYYVMAYGIDIYREWAARAATPALMRCADGFSMHPYLPAPEDVLRAEPELRAFIAAHWAKPAAPLVVFSEWGYAIDRKRTPADQAALQLRALLIGAGLKRATNLYQAVDDQRDRAKAGKDGYGLVTYHGAFKPSGDAVRRLMRAAGRYGIEGIDTLGGAGAGEAVYRFRARSGRARAYVLWTGGRPGTARMPAGARAVNLVTGAAAPAASGAVAIGPAPVLVSWLGG